MQNKTEPLFKICPCKKTEDLFQNSYTDLCFSCGRQNLYLLEEDAPRYLKNLPQNYKALKIENEEGIYVPSFNDSGKELLFLETKDDVSQYVIVPYTLDENGSPLIEHSKSVRYDFMNFNQVFKDFYGTKLSPNEI
jgi:hypothetical protein